MSTIQHLVTNLEKQQQELDLKLATALELEKVLQKKHQQNLETLKEQILEDLNADDVKSGSAKNDTLNIPINNLALTENDIDQTLSEIFKI